MKRILVIGCPGSGKSTFSKSLHSLSQIPLFHLDNMYWNYDKTIVDKEIFINRLNHALQSETWIIDGNYASTLEMRLQYCDTVIFLDYPVETCLQGIKERQGKVRTDIPWVETEDDTEFIEFIHDFESQIRPKIIHLLNKYSDKQIYHFKERKEADYFLLQLSSK